ncbi:MAG TPA: hypothetical protein VGB75_15830 [Jatrophihabitans sp.]|jgi:hypothetical protein|uniref:hypothetical protein n=1 Tax=Jatrophihabitans sp. TaxID=1932789 RepID=UPI002F10AE3F
MTGIWTFAGAVVLPLPLVAALVIIAALGEWPSRKVHQGGRPVKYAVSIAGLASAYLAAAFVVSHVPGPSGVALAVPTVCLLNVGYVAALYYISGGRNGLRMFLDPRLHLIEVSTQGLGAVVGLAMLYWHPLLAVGALVLLYGLHLASLRHAVDVTESFDSVTGLWSEEAWMVQAQQRLHDVYGSVALFMIDPDEAGQEVRILQTIESGLQPSDLLGRYGSRQILVLIPVGLPEGGPFLATGFRKDLAAAGVRAALGCATTADAELEGLLIEAMSDLMGRRDAAGITRNW